MVQSVSLNPDVPEVKLGSMLLTLLEPAPGTVHSFNRWYERDHFYAGCMVGANFFSGKRWLATRRLKSLRKPERSDFTPHIGKGSFLATYWILDGAYTQALEWSIAQVHTLNAQGRMSPPRENISSGFYQFQWHVSRDPDGVPVELALDHPFQGLALSVFERTDSTTPAQLHQQLCSALQGMDQGYAAQLSLCFEALPLPESVPDYVPRVPEQQRQRRSLLLHFFDRSPDSGWLPFINDLESNVSAKLIYSAPFIPTIPGTDRYLDEL